MKKTILLLALLFFPLPAFAGSNLFSSNNEQYGTISITYQNLATVYGYKAEANYLKYLLYTQMGSAQQATAFFDSYQYCLDEAQKNANIADKYLQKMIFTIPFVDNETITDEMQVFPSFKKAMTK